MTLVAGTRLGPYEILEPIGAGGMGEVYRARDTKLDREVAIKVLPEEFAKDKERLARFEREAKLLASLNHPNIASIYGLEESDGVKALVLELVDGPTLAERIAEGPIPVAEAIPLFIQMAEGLQSAHEKGVIHRDLKPANIKVGPPGKPKILDFGLAKAFSTERDLSAEASESPTVTKGTALGVIMGTASYMSPEQARGKPLNKQTDVWAFGCCLYEALFGVRAFKGKTVSDTLAAVLRAEIEWPTSPSGPGSPRHVLDRCLQRDTTYRWHDIADVRLALEDVESSNTERRNHTGSTSSLRWIALLVVGIALGTAFAVWRGVRPVPSGVFRTQIALPEGMALTAGGSQSSVAVSPDGGRVLYVLDGDVWVRELDTLQDQKLVTSKVTTVNPSFSKDGEWVYYSEPGEIWKIPIDGGVPVQVASLRGGPGRALTPGGDLVLSGARLRLLPPNSKSPQLLASTRAERLEKIFKYPQVLPGGDWVLVTVGTLDMETYDEAHIVAISSSTGERRTLIEGGSYARYVASGHLVYGHHGSLFGIPFDTDRLEVTGSPVVVVENLATDPLYGAAYYDVSNTGTLVWAPGPLIVPANRVVRIDRTGKAEALDLEPGPYRRIYLSPDGDRLSVEIEGANMQIWSYDFERSTLSRLTFLLGNHEYHAWSPEGDALVWGATQSDSNAIVFSMATDGSEAPRELARGSFRPTSWSPDGKRIALENASDGNIWMLALTPEHEPVPFLERSSRQSEGHFSPDGSLLAYVSDETGRSDVFIRSSSGRGGQIQISSNGGRSPRWNPNGHELFYVEGRVPELASRTLSIAEASIPRLMAVDIRRIPRLEAARPELLFEGNISRHYDVAPDGDHFYFVQPGAPPRLTRINVALNWFEDLERLVPTEN